MTVACNHLDAVRSFRREGATVLLEGGGGPSLAITALTERIVRVRLAPSGSFAARRSWAVVPPDSAFAGSEFAISESPAGLQMHTTAVTVELSYAGEQISFRDQHDQLFCADVPDQPWQANANGQVVGRKQIAAGEHFFGGGERTGPLDKRGFSLINWTTDQYRYSPNTDPLYIAIPTVLALRPGLAYGVFLNSTWRSRFDLGLAQPDVWQLETEGGELDYYVVYGPTPAEVLAGFGQLLGTMPMPPRWALGYHQSRWSYGSAAELTALASEFRQRGLPCDAIHLDIDYMDGYRDFTWNHTNFPDPAGLVAELRQHEIRLVPIIDAGVKVDPAYAVYADGIERDMFIRRADGTVFNGYVWPDDSVFADYLRPEVRAWWGAQQRALTAAGVTAVWNDMNEPTVFTLPFSAGGGTPVTIDLDAPQGPADERTLHREVHNLYGSSMAQASYEGLRQATGERPFVLTRSGFAGIQRWSACWMGDNASRWDHLEMAMPQLLNMGLSGVAFVGTDIGGFYDNATGELFARWMQLGALMPFCRGHSSAGTARHEPWSFGPEIEAICATYLRLRYQLLPYVYSLFWQAAEQGAPILRPLLYHFPADPAVYQLHDQVMLGQALLAAPVYQPGRTHRQVYLPAGQWFDWWSDQQLDGPQHLLAAAPLDRMPLYVAAGTILPTGPASASAGAQQLDPLMLDLYPGTGSFTLYEDDGLTFAHEQGEFCLTEFELRLAGDRLVFTIGARRGNYHPARQQLVIRLHGATAACATAYPAASFDPARRILTIVLVDHGAAQQLSFALDEEAV